MNRMRWQWWGLAILLAAPAHAFDCPYFRLSFHLTRCGPTTAKPTQMPDYTAPELDVPDIAKTADKPFAKVTCTCTYSLSGSDPRCDFDRTDENVSIIPVDNVADACRRGADLCDNLCPRQISR